MTYASRTLGFSDSEPAKLRLHCIEVYDRLGWEGLQAAFPQLKRATFFRWRAAYLTSGKKLASLVPHSTKPKRVRHMHTPPAVVAQIKLLRETYPRLGKMKLKPLLDEWCLEWGHTTLQPSTIGKIITRYHFFYAGKRRKARSLRAAPRLRYCPKAGELAPGYVQVDGVRVYDLNRYCYFLTGVDVVTKQAWAVQVPSFTSRAATAFVHRLLATSNTPVHTIQTDNGSEFAGVFEATLKELPLIHLKSRPGSPKANGYIERFNWTLKDEFLHSHEEYLHDPLQLHQKLLEWLTFYHTKRVHQSLNYQTPYQYATKKGIAVS